MKRTLLFLCLFILAFCGVTADVHAQRRIPIPVVWGSGEKMTEMGDLPSDVASAVADELGTQVTVAFINERAHLCYLDVWTWNGRYVLHSGDKYWEPDSTEWQSMIGTEPSAKYGKPILYRIPLLPSLLILGVVGYFVRKQFFKTAQEKLEALMTDGRYQRSIETMIGQSSGEESATALTTLDEQRFFDAKNQLIGEGVAAHTAEANLRMIADAIFATPNAKIDEYLALASQLDQSGEWDQCAEIYSQLISRLPESDDRKVYAQNCLTSVNEKRFANATESSDAPEHEEANQ